MKYAKNIQTNQQWQQNSCYNLKKKSEIPNFHTQKFKKYSNPNKLCPKHFLCKNMVQKV
jgi:hypothetical protein